jgi:hypothetical protein
MASTASRDLEWFPASRGIDIGTPSRPPKPRIAALETSNEDTLLVGVLRPAPTWRSAWPRNLPVGATSVNLADMQPHLLYTSRLEAISKSGQLLAAIHFDHPIVSMLPYNQVVLYAPLLDGTPRLVILSVQITSIG